jgi:hypothetical protein
MEMGEPPPEQSAEPAAWIHSRQFTGRICTVTNDKTFDEPFYSYTHHFPYIWPYIWDEVRLPVHHTQDHAKAEAILLEAARRHALTDDKVERDKLEELDGLYGLYGLYGLKHLDIAPRVLWRLTDNWLEMAFRFLVSDHGTRQVKDAKSREILAGLDAAGLNIASSTQEITLIKG